MFTFTVVSTKGGEGKTTHTANLGGLLCDIGFRVLLIDADIQPSLSRYYALDYQSPNGLTQLIRSGFLTPDCISHCQIAPASYTGKRVQQAQSDGLLHIVQSDTEDGKLQEWMATRNPMDLSFRLKNPLKQDAIRNAYDIVIIDTQGAVGHLQDAAIMAADMLLVPVSPDMVSAREFISGTKKLIERHECVSNMGLTMPPMKAVLSRTENTTDCRQITQIIKESFIDLSGRITLLDAVVPAAVAYRKAATSQVPVHWIDPSKASDTMHKLLWELIPSVEGLYAPNHREFTDLNSTPASADQ